MQTRSDDVVGAESVNSPGGQSGVTGEQTPSRENVTPSSHVAQVLSFSASPGVSSACPAGHTL